MSDASRQQKGVDKLDPKGHELAAKLLASDEYQIFAVAKYLRLTADKGAPVPPATLPKTRAEFPGINMAAYANDSVTWPDDNIKAIASEYTSRSWDDVLYPGWTMFVWEAYQDVKRSGIL